MLVGCFSTRAQVRHTAPVMFPLDVYGGKYVYRVHPINVQLVADPMVMAARKNTDVILVQKVWTNTSHVTSCIVVCKEVIKVSLLQKGQNDKIGNIVSVVYGIQCSLNNFELSSNIMTNSSPEDNTPSSKTDGLVHTLLRKTFSTPR